MVCLRFAFAFWKFAFGANRGDRDCSNSNQLDETEYGLPQSMKSRFMPFGQDAFLRICSGRSSHGAK